MKEKIIKILESYLEEDINGIDNKLHKVYFDSIATEIKNLIDLQNNS